MKKLENIRSSRFQTLEKEEIRRASGGVGNASQTTSASIWTYNPPNSKWDTQTFDDSQPSVPYNNA